MHNPTLKRTFAWLMGLTLLFSTAGVSIHQIYCYCLDQTRVTLFVEEDACQQEATASAPAPCCKKDVPVCCAKTMAPEQDCSGEPSEHDCTRKTTKVFQLKVQFLPDAPAGMKDFPPAVPALAPEFPGFVLTSSKAPCLPVYHNKPPPPLSGRDIGIRLQTFRC